MKMSQELLDRYVGPHIDTYAGYAVREEHRINVASGGVMTTLLRHALSSGYVDGVAAGTADFSQRGIGYRIKILTDPNELEKFGASSYFNIPIERHFKEIRAFDGKLALCALPCHIGMFTRTKTENIKLKLSLFCGHNNEAELLRFVFNKHGVDETQVSWMKVDRSYLGGSLVVHLRDGSISHIPFRHFNVYRSLWLFSKPICKVCDDHLGRHADISVGDIFIKEYRKRDIKHSAVVVRSELGQAFFETVKEAGLLNLDVIPAEKVFAAQKRVLLPSGDLASRYFACRLIGYPADKSMRNGVFRVRSFITSLLQLLNSKLSNTRVGLGLIGLTPKPILYGYIAAIKLVNNTLRPRIKA